MAEAHPWTPDYYWPNKWNITYWDYTYPVYKTYGPGYPGNVSVPYPGSTYAIPTIFDREQLYNTAIYYIPHSNYTKIKGYSSLASEGNKTFVTPTDAENLDPGWTRPKYQTGTDKGQYISTRFPVGGALLPSLGAEWISQNIWSVNARKSELNVVPKFWHGKPFTDQEWNNYPIMHGLTIQQWYNAGVEDLSKPDVDKNIKNYPNLAEVAYNTLALKGPHKPYRAVMAGGDSASVPEWTVNPYSSDISKYLDGIEIHQPASLPNNSPSYNSLHFPTSASYAPQIGNGGLDASSFTPSTGIGIQKNDYYRISVPPHGAAISTTFENTVEWSNQSISSETSAWSNATSISATAAVKAGLGPFSGSFSTSLGNTTSVNNTSATHINSSQAGSQKIGPYHYTVRPGMDVALKVTYQQGTLHIPYRCPATIILKDGNITGTGFFAKADIDSDDSGMSTYVSGSKFAVPEQLLNNLPVTTYNYNTKTFDNWTVTTPLELTPEDIVNYARKYQVPGWQLLTVDTVGGQQNYRMSSTGTIELTTGSTASIKEYLIVDGQLESYNDLKASSLLKSHSDSQKDDLSTKTAMGSTGYTRHSGGSIEVNGEEKTIGVMHINGVTNGTYVGSNYADGFHLEKPGQTAHLFSGDDFVKGSIYADTIISDNNGIGGNKIESGAGDDYIEARNGGEFINAGAGDDEIHITLDSALVDNVYLGSGSDKLTIDLSKNPTGYALTLQDLEHDDELTFVGGSVNAEIFGSSVLIYSNGNHIATFLDYAKSFDNHHIQNLQEVGLLNMNLLRDNDYDYVTDWRGDLIKASAQGESINDDHASLVNSRSALKKNLQEMQIYFFDETDHRLTKWGLAKAEDYESARDFANDFLLKASGIFKEDYQLPIGYF